MKFFVYIALAFFMVSIFNLQAQNLEVEGNARIHALNGTHTRMVTVDSAGILGAEPIPAGGSSQWTNSGSNIYFNTGNVGIGVSNPQEKLHLDGDMWINNSGSIEWKDDTTTRAEVNFENNELSLESNGDRLALKPSIGHLDYESPSDPLFSINDVDGGDSYLSFSSLDTTRVLAYTRAQDQDFVINNAFMEDSLPRYFDLVIKNDGKVGIGTELPAGALHVENNTLNGADMWLSSFFGDAKMVLATGIDNAYNLGIINTSASQEHFQISRGIAPYIDEVELLRLDKEGRLSLTPNNSSRSMTIMNQSKYYHNQADSLEMGLGSGSFLMASEEYQIETGGIYGDGDALTLWSPGDGHNGTQALVYFLDEDNWSDGDDDPYNNGAIQIYLDASGTWQASDMNRKENIAEFNGALDKIKTLKTYTYAFKQTAEEVAKHTPKMSAIGVMAQELHQVLPEAVNISDDGEFFVNHSMLTPVLIQAINEQQTIINSLEARLLALENK